MVKTVADIFKLKKPSTEVVGSRSIIANWIFYSLHKEHSKNI